MKKNKNKQIQPRRSYTQEEKEKAIMLVYKLGSYASACRQTGYPVSNLREWVIEADKGDNGVLRRAIHAKITIAAYSSLMIGVEKFKDIIEAFLEEHKPQTIEEVSKLAETLERVSRTLKNLGAVATKIEYSGEVTLTVGSKKVEDMTLSDLLEVGKATVTDGRFGHN